MQLKEYKKNINNRDIYFEIQYNNELIKLYYQIDKAIQSNDNSLFIEAFIKDNIVIIIEFYNSASIKFDKIAFDEFVEFCKQQNYTEVNAEISNSPFDDEGQEELSKQLKDYGFIISAPEGIIIGNLSI